MRIRENQNTEFKESWRDGYLKTICAFANAQGGVLYIGVNDAGETIGVSNAKKLLEDIPNQIKNSVGLIVAVNIKKEKGKESICIKVKTALTPVTHKGKFYMRSGSTTQELNCQALQHFLLERSNLTWERILEPDASIDDIDARMIFSFSQRNVFWLKRVLLVSEPIIDFHGAIKGQRGAKRVEYNWRPER